MKAFNESHRAPARRAGLILLFDGEVGRQRRTSIRLSSNPLNGRDEHDQADILTSGMKTSPPPSRLPKKPVALAASLTCEWELVARYSGATVPDSHGVP